MEHRLGSLSRYVQGWSLPAQEGAERASLGDVSDDVIRSEPPGTDPYAGWCGGRRLITSGYPISLFPEPFENLFGRATSISFD
jgi:hypothetical protein